MPVWLCPTFHLPEKASPQPGTGLISPFWVLPCDSVDFFNKDGKFLPDCRNTFHAFTLFPNITLKKREVQPCEGTKVQHHYLYPHYTEMYHSQDLELFLTFLSLYCSTSHQTISPQAVPDVPDFTATVRISKMLCEAFLMLWIFALYATYPKNIVSLRRSDVSFHEEHFHTHIFISATLYIHVYWHFLGVSWWPQFVLSLED